MNRAAGAKPRLKKREHFQNAACTKGREKVGAGYLGDSVSFSGFGKLFAPHLKRKEAKHKTTHVNPAKTKPFVKHDGDLVTTLPYGAETIDVKTYTSPSCSSEANPRF